MIKSGEGSAGLLLHKITTPTIWRRGVQILKKEDEDARMSDRCEAKRKEWVKRWQCDEELQNKQNKQCRNEDLKKYEEALPRLTGRRLGKCIWIVQSKNRSGMRRIPPESSF